MTFRFVHTADLHLDSPLRSLALRGQELADMVGTASRHALTKTVQLCLDEQVDALLIAGDLYDGHQTSMKTARFLADELGRLHEAGIRTFIIRGNHDALSKITKQLILPDSVHCFGSKAGCVAMEKEAHGFAVNIHGLSFKEEKAPESLLPSYRMPIPDSVNIGLMHTSLDGSPQHDNYAPCKLAALHASGFNYWALGHIHARSAYAGSCMVVMPGMTQGRDVNEAGPKSVSLVTIADDQTIDIEERHISAAEFATVPIDMMGVGTWEEAIGIIEKGLGQAQLQATSDVLIARLCIEGQTPMAARLRWDVELLRAEADRLADQGGRVFIEKLEVRAQEPKQDAQKDGNPLPELRRLITSEVLATDSYREALMQLVNEIKSEIPRDCANLFNGDPVDVARLLNTLAIEGTDEVLARLQEQETGGPRP